MIFLATKAENHIYFNIKYMKYLYRLNNCDKHLNSILFFSMLIVNYKIESFIAANTTIFSNQVAYKQLVEF